MSDILLLVFSFFKYEQQYLVHFVMIRKRACMCCGVYLTEVTGTLPQSYEKRVLQNLLFTAARHDMFLPWVLPVLLSAAIRHVLLFSVRAALLMMTITLLTFVSGALATVHRVILFGMFLMKVQNSCFYSCKARWLLHVTQIPTYKHLRSVHTVYSCVFLWISEQMAIQRIPFGLGHHLWPLRHGRPYQ